VENFITEWIEAVKYYHPHIMFVLVGGRKEKKLADAKENVITLQQGRQNAGI
jgi:hypothetical protein